MPTQAYAPRKAQEIAAIAHPAPTAQAQEKKQPQMHPRPFMLRSHCRHSTNRHQRSNLRKLKANARPKAPYRSPEEAAIAHLAPEAPEKDEQPQPAEAYGPRRTPAAVHAAELPQAQHEQSQEN